MHGRFTRMTDPYTVEAPDALRSFTKFARDNLKHFFSSGRFWFPTQKDINTLFIFKTRHIGGGILLWTIEDEALQCCTSAVCLTKMYWNVASPCPIRFTRWPSGGATDVPHRASSTSKSSSELLLYNNVQPHPQKPRRSTFENPALASASARNYKRGCVTSI